MQGRWKRTEFRREYSSIRLRVEEDLGDLSSGGMSTYKASSKASSEELIDEYDNIAYFWQFDEIVPDLGSKDFLY